MMCKEKKERREKLVKKFSLMIWEENELMKKSFLTNLVKISDEKFHHFLHAILFSL